MNKKIIALSASIISLTLPVVAFAAGPLNVELIIGNVLNMVVWPLFIGAVVVMFVWAGFLFVTAQGDPSKIQMAKKAVLWAILGAIVGIAAFSMVRIIKNILGVGGG